MLHFRPMAARCVIFFAATMLAFAPLFHSLIIDQIYRKNAPTIQSVQYLSPILSLASIWEKGRLRSDYQLYLRFDDEVPICPLWVVHIGVYLTLAIALAIANAIRAPRVKRRRESET